MAALYAAAYLAFAVIAHSANHVAAIFAFFFPAISSFPRLAALPLQEQTWPPANPISIAYFSAAIIAILFLLPILRRRVRREQGWGHACQLPVASVR